jgi:hypothetical protein
MAIASLILLIVAASTILVHFHRRHCIPCFHESIPAGRSERGCCTPDAVPNISRTSVGYRPLEQDFNKPSGRCCFLSTLLVPWTTIRSSRFQMSTCDGFSANSLSVSRTTIRARPLRRVSISCTPSIHVRRQAAGRQVCSNQPWTTILYSSLSPSPRCRVLSTDVIQCV